MKEFNEMTDQEFDEAVSFAKDEPDSRFCLFMQRTAGFKFFRKDNLIATPRYVLFHRFKNYPRQLELIEAGTHPDYKAVVKDAFDDIQEEIFSKDGQERI